MPEPAWLTSGRGAQMESVCPKIIARIGGCLLSAQFSPLETGLPSRGCLPSGKARSSILSRVTFQVGLEGPFQPTAGNDSTLKGYKHSQRSHLSPACWAGWLSAPAEEEAGQEVRRLASGHAVN